MENTQEPSTIAVDEPGKEEKMGTTKLRKTRKKRAAKKSQPAKVVAAKSKGKGTGTRYSAAEKKEIVDFAVSLGRGGQTKAAKKYKVSMLSLSRWMKGVPKAGKKSKGKVGRPKGTGKKRGRPSGVKATTHPIIAKRTQKRILKGLKRMAHGIELLAEAFGHIT
jgi:hypothetical protein